VDIKNVKRIIVLAKKKIINEKFEFKHFCNNKNKKICFICKIALITEFIIVNTYIKMHYIMLVAKQYFNVI